MIKWKEYSNKDGEMIEFCCDPLKSIYSNLLTWDPAEKKWAIKVDRITTYQDPYTSKYLTKKVEGMQDLKSIKYCPFCGANCYKDELRYDSWIRRTDSGTVFHVELASGGVEVHGGITHS